MFVSRAVMARCGGSVRPLSFSWLLSSQRGSAARRGAFWEGTSEPGKRGRLRCKNHPLIALDLINELRGRTQTECLDTALGIVVCFFLVRVEVVMQGKCLTSLLRQTAMDATPRLL